MAMTSVLTQGASAQMGSPTNFVVAISNSGGAQVNVLSMQPVARLPSGGLATCCTIDQPYVTPQTGLAQVGGSQFNVPIAGGTTSYFTFQICFFGPQISGGPTQPSMAFVVDCINSYSDGTSSGVLAPIQLNLNQPQFGQAPGAPPNPTPSIGQLNFQAPANTVLAL